MADNISIKDGNGSAVTVRSTDNAGVQTPHHIADIVLTVTTLQTIAANGAAAAGTGVSGSSRNTFQATVSGTGTVTATVQIQGSNDNTNWITLGTITLSGTTSATDGFASSAPWAYVRSNCTAISGTSAALSVLMGA